MDLSTPAFGGLAIPSLCPPGASPSLCLPWTVFSRSTCAITSHRGGQTNLSVSSRQSSSQRDRALPQEYHRQHALTASIAAHKLPPIIQPTQSKSSHQASPTPFLQPSAKTSNMPREGTRSQTGNSRPRIFQAIDTGPATPRRKPSLKSRLTPGPAKPGKDKKEKEKAKEKQKKKSGAGAGGRGGVVDRVRSAVGLAPKGPGKVQKKGGVKRAVQKVGSNPLRGRLVRGVCRTEKGGWGRISGMKGSQPSWFGTDSVVRRSRPQPRLIRTPRLVCPLFPSLPRLHPNPPQ